MSASSCSRTLPIPPRRWAPPDAPVRVEGLHLDPKPELHITLVGNALGRELHATFGRHADALLDGAVAAQEWDWARTGRQLLLRKASRVDGAVVTTHSIIELIELPAMAGLHRALGHALGRQLPVPPPHVTLYVAGREKGIGVASPDRLRAFTVADHLHRLSRGHP